MIDVDEDDSRIPTVAERDEGSIRTTRAQGLEKRVAAGANRYLISTHFGGLILRDATIGGGQNRMRSNAIDALP